MAPTCELGLNGNDKDVVQLKTHINDVLVAILKSEKKEMSLKSVTQIFKALCGRDIPFQQLGFKSIDDFLLDNAKLYSFSKKQNDEIWLVISSGIQAANIDHMSSNIDNDIKMNDSDIANLSPSGLHRKKKPTNTFLYNNKWVPQEPKNPYKDNGNGYFKMSKY